MSNLKISKSQFATLMNAIINQRQKEYDFSVALQPFFYERPLPSMTEELTDAILGFLYTSIEVDPVKNDILHWFIYEDVDNKNIYDENGDLFFEIKDVEDLYDYLDFINN